MYTQDIKCIMQGIYANLKTVCLFVWVAIQFFCLNCDTSENELLLS